MKNKKVIFMGTPEFSVSILEMLIKETNVILVVTMPDKKVGRKQLLTPTPIKKLALENNIKVITPNKIMDEINLIKSLKPDIIITCAYGKILPKEILDVPLYKSINVHASILPKYRGASPIHNAIINGEEETGITIMYMDDKIDNGDIIKISKIKIDKSDNTGVLHDKLSILGKDLLKETLPLIFSNKIERVKQNNKDATYTYPLTKEDEHLTFDDTAINIHNKVRGLNPYPGCYININDNIIKIIETSVGENINKPPGIITNINKDSIIVSTKDKELIITKIKPSGKKEMLVRDYINGIKKEELLGVRIK